MDLRRAVGLSGAVVVSICQGQCLDLYPEDGLRLMAAANSGVCAMVHAQCLPD
jgi:hypothetical protein